MANHAEVVAKVAEQGGAAVAVGSFFAWVGGVTQWLNHNSAAVLAMCGVAGALISLAGWLTNLYYQEKRFRFDLRQRARRD